MLGTIVNAIAIVAGGLVGIALGGRLHQNYRSCVLQAVGLTVILIGIKGALKSDDLLIVTMSLVVGSVIGTFLGIEERLNRLGQRLENMPAVKGRGAASGFVTSSLVFCVGAMAVVGSLESGLTGNHQTLYAKSILDGLGAAVFASTLGIGVLFSAVSVLLYQGLITLGAGFMQSLLTPAIIDQMSCVGGVLILALGISLLEIKTLQIGNMLPSIFIPLIYYAARQLF